MNLDRRFRLGVLFWILVLLAGCPGPQPEEKESRMLEDLEPHAVEEDKVLGESTTPLPIPEERPFFRADPEDPRAASTLQDLDPPTESIVKGETPSRPQAIPEEERPPKPRQ